MFGWRSNPQTCFATPWCGGRLNHRLLYESESGAVHSLAHVLYMQHEEFTSLLSCTP